MTVHHTQSSDVDTCTTAESPTPIPAFGSHAGVQPHLIPDHHASRNNVLCSTSHFGAFSFHTQPYAAQASNGQQATRHVPRFRRTAPSDGRTCCGTAASADRFVEFPTDGFDNFIPHHRLRPIGTRQCRSIHARALRDPEIHLLVGNTEWRNLCNGVDHTPWTSAPRLTKITNAPLVTTRGLSV